MKKYLASFIVLGAAFLAVFCCSGEVLASADFYGGEELPPRPIETTKPTEEVVIETVEPEEPKGTVQRFEREENIEQWDIRTTLLLLLGGGVVLCLILFMLARRKKL